MEAMDLMDPKRRLQHNVRLIVGYVLVGIALLLLTIILLFVAYGFGLQNGRVTQSGLLFLSSQPNPAHIYLNGDRYQNDTNTKLLLDEGTYQVELQRDGYRSWQRPITVTGGEVVSYTYPFLFPLNLTTTTLHTYVSAPSQASESLDQHWLLAEQAGGVGTFDLYDLTSPSQAPLAITMPSTLLTTSRSKSTLTIVAWADDNTHVLLAHTYGSDVEYILLNRSNPNQSQNLTKTLQLPASGITLVLDSNQQDHYLVLDAASHVLSRSSLSAPTLQPMLDQVLAFAVDDDSGITYYVTPDTAHAGMVSVMAYDGTTKYTVRHDNASGHYLLAAASFTGSSYLAFSAPSENTAYIYKDPIKQIKDPHFGVAVPAQVFMIKQPNFVDFAPDGQYAVFESGQHFVTYDAGNQQGFSYTAPDKLDAADVHATWMDQARLYLVSGGQVVVFDYDGHNRQTLVSADPKFPLAFDNNYKFLYAFALSADKSHELLTSTNLRSPADQ